MDNEIFSAALDELNILSEDLMEEQ